MVRQWQEMFYEERYSHVDLQASPDFVKLVEAYGGVGFRATTPEEYMAVLQLAKAVTDRPVVIDCQIPTSENVYPMIPSGQTIEEMMVKTDLEAAKASVHADGEEWSFSAEEAVLSHYVEAVNAGSKEQV
jgi:acetolactate synthase-1/2/3 large subunit